MNNIEIKDIKNNKDCIIDNKEDIIDNSEKFIKLREEYSEFHYKSFNIGEDSESINVSYVFEIPHLAHFEPQLKILKKDFKLKSINSNIVKNMVFSMGMVELISYWKCACPKNVIIDCMSLNDEQINWWKKLYYYGLGELLYRNNIKVSIDDFMNVKSASDISYKNEDEALKANYSGYIVPIGGGKDSVVTLETLPLDKNKDYCLIINPKPVTLECAKIAGFKNSNIIEIKRTIDKTLINLNNKGFINGHTPFSAMLAFVSYFISYLLGKKYIALSNENSANESNVVGEKINHQYSKSLEFENDFEYYTNKYLKTCVKYFSFLRPLNELQIAKLFSKHKKYHQVFRSCNVGSKGKEWVWCCNCPKCLFAFTILSPFLYKEELVNIFKEDLFEKESLLNTFIELTGNGPYKPFDCVGTFDEVNYAISKTIQNIEKDNKPLPYLLKYYKDNFKMYDTTNDITKQYNENTNLTKEQNEILKKEVFSND